MKVTQIQTMKDYREMVENLMKLPKEETSVYVANIVENSPPVEQVVLQEVLQYLKDGKQTELVAECEATLETLKRSERWLVDSQIAEEHQMTQILTTLTKALHTDFGNRLNLIALEKALEKLLTIIDELRDGQMNIDVHNLPKENLNMKKKMNDVMYG